MPTRTSLPARAAAASALVLLLAGCGGTGSEGAGSEEAGPSPAAAAETSAPSAPSGPASAPARDRTGPGAYLDWADYQADRSAHTDQDVVLFFHAAWCPTCRAAEESLESEGVPAGLSVVKVDFDDSADLRRTYGVTVQHTFVQIDADGDPVKAWTGSESGDEIADQVA